MRLDGPYASSSPLLSSPLLSFFFFFFLFYFIIFFFFALEFVKYAVRQGPGRKKTVLAFFNFQYFGRISCIIQVCNDQEWRNQKKIPTPKTEEPEKKTKKKTYNKVLIIYHENIS